MEAVALLFLVVGLIFSALALLHNHTLQRRIVLLMVQPHVFLALYILSDRFWPYLAYASLCFAAGVLLTHRWPHVRRQIWRWGRSRPGDGLSSIGHDDAFSGGSDFVGGGGDFGGGGAGDRW